MDEHTQKIQAKVLTAIKRGEIVMRPRWHFVLKTVLATLGFIILFLVLIYLMSLIMFGLRETGILFAPGFGWYGMIVFLKSLPWILIILIGVFLIVLELLVQKYSFAYRRPLLYSAGIMVVIILGTAWMLARTPLHVVMMHRMEMRPLPVMHNLYREIREPVWNNAEVGKIIFFTNKGFDMKNPRQEVIIVSIHPGTRIIAREALQVGDRVIVVGKKIGSTIEALGVRQIPEMK